MLMQCLPNQLRWHKLKEVGLLSNASGYIYSVGKVVINVKLNIEHTDSNNTFDEDSKNPLN